MRAGNLNTLFPVIRSFETSKMERDDEKIILCAREAPQKDIAKISSLCSTPAPSLPLLQDKNNESKIRAFNELLKNNGEKLDEINDDDGGYDYDDDDELISPPKSKSYLVETKTRTKIESKTTTTKKKDVVSDDENNDGDDDNKDALTKKEVDENEEVLNENRKRKKEEKDKTNAGVSIQSRIKQFFSSKITKIWIVMLLILIAWETYKHYGSNGKSYRHEAAGEILKYVSETEPPHAVYHMIKDTSESVGWFQYGSYEPMTQSPYPILYNHIDDVYY